MAAEDLSRKCLISTGSFLHVCRPRYDNKKKHRHCWLGRSKCSTPLQESCCAIMSKTGSLIKEFIKSHQIPLPAVVRAQIRTENLLFAVLFSLQTRCPLTEDELAEARVRLVVGFKRYFHGKRIEGLLSSRVSLLLDLKFCCCMHCAHEAITVGSDLQRSHL